MPRSKLIHDVENLCYGKLGLGMHDANDACVILCLDWTQSTKACPSFAAHHSLCYILSGMSIKRNEEGDV